MRINICLIKDYMNTQNINKFPMTAGSPNTHISQLQISGAGILIVERYNGMNCYTFFRDMKGHYNEPGGIRDGGETPQETACRECREETSNLIQLSPNILNEYVIVDQYMAFVVYLDGLHKTDYIHNSKITRRKCAHHWAETNDMERVPLQNINLNYLPNVVTYEGKNIQLRGRTCKVVIEASKIIVRFLQQQPITLFRQITNLSRNQCLIGTITYTAIPLRQPLVQQYNKMSNKNFAIYVAPDIQFTKYKVLQKCNKKFGGIHITLAGFSSSHPINLLNQLPITTKHWTPDVNSIYTADKHIIIRSNTLDKLAEQLNLFGFKKIKGPFHKGDEWHMSLNCKNIKKVMEILLLSTWAIYVVVEKNNKLKWKRLLEL